MIFSVVGCSFIYPCWSVTACCSLLTWAETKWVRQLIIHGAIISSINMGTIRTRRGISQLKSPITRMTQVPSCSGIRRSISCLFWSTTPAKLYWLLRAVLGNLITRKLILAVFITMALMYSSEYVSEISQRLSGVLSVLFCFLTRLDSWVVNPGVVSWYLDCCGGRKFYRVGVLPCGLELILWGPIFPDFN